MARPRNFAALLALAAYAGGIALHALTGWEWVILWLGVLGIVLTCGFVMTALALKDLPASHIELFARHVPSTWVRVAWAVFAVPVTIFLLSGGHPGLGTIMVGLTASAVALVSLIDSNYRRHFPGD